MSKGEGKLDTEMGCRMSWCEHPKDSTPRPKLCLCDPSMCAKAPESPFRSSSQFELLVSHSLIQGWLQMQWNFLKLDIILHEEVTSFSKEFIVSWMLVRGASEVLSRNLTKMYIQNWSWHGMVVRLKRTEGNGEIVGYSICCVCV